MTYLIIAEKPSQARNFAKFLNGMTGSFEGKDYIITSSAGHVLAHKKPDEGGVQSGYESSFNNWSKVSGYPWDTSKITWGYKVQPGKNEIIQKIRELSKKPGVDAIVIATDVDPDSGEGELIGWELINSIGWKGKVFRLDHEETEKSVRNGMRNLRDITDQMKDGDYLKAVARSKWDYISMQLSPVATILSRQKGHNIVVRQGRLKSVMMNLVGQREDEIKAYVKKPYYEIQYKDETGNIYKVKLPKIEADDAFENGLRFMDKETAQLACSLFKPSDVSLEGEEVKHTAPPKLLDLASIGAALAPKGIKPKEVEETYQKMYENQVVSYPRTEDKLINQEQFEEMLPYLPKIASVIGIDTNLLTHREARKSHVGNSGPHGANRPGTNVPQSLEDLSQYGPQAAIIYELLARNFLAMFCEDYEYQLTKATVNKSRFITTCTKPLRLGWKSIYKDEDETDENVNPIGHQASAFVYEGSNKKPQQPSIKWLMKHLERYNVGTGATRIKTVGEISDGPKAIMKESKGKLSLNETGRMSYLFLEGTRIGSPEATQELFNQMKEVAQLKRDPRTIEQHANDVMAHDIEQFKLNAQRIPQGNDSFEKKEKATATSSKGKEISFTKTWGGYTFSDDDIAKLSAGEEISFTRSDGKTFTGMLKHQSYKGKKFIGFMPDFAKGYAKAKSLN